MEIFIHPETNSRKMVLLKVDRAFPGANARLEPPTEDPREKPQSAKRPIGKIIIDIKEGSNSQYNYDLTLIKRDDISQNDLSFSFAEIDKHNPDAFPDSRLSRLGSGISTSINRKNFPKHANWDSIGGRMSPPGSSQFFAPENPKTTRHPYMPRFSRKMQFKRSQMAGKSRPEEPVEFPSRGKIFREKRVFWGQNRLSELKIKDFFEQNVILENLKNTSEKLKSNPGQDATDRGGNGQWRFERVLNRPETAVSPRVAELDRKEQKVSRDQFANLEQVITKVFLMEKVQPDDLMLRDHELLILKLLLIKKGFPIRRGSEISARKLNNLMQFPLKKKKEYNLKFVMLKCINHLKMNFFEKELQLKLEQKSYGVKLLQNKDICFYDFYFGEVAKRRKIPIESFFVFKNWTHRYHKNIPKSITTRSLSLWKQNPDFIAKIREYLHSGFVADFGVFNKTKISKMVRSWGRLVSKFGLENAVTSIAKSFQSRSCKLPWTLSEVKNAIQATEEVLEN